MEENPQLTCTMHSEVIKDASGKCTQHGMDLVFVNSTSHSVLQISYTFHLVPQQRKTHYTLIKSIEGNDALTG